jgi:predicted nucleotidyltransferase
VLPLEEVVGLKPGRETIERSGVHDGLEIDLVTHDVRKFFGLLLKKNGYVLEQVLSPLVVHTTPEHAELQDIARQCVTRHHAHHYLGFAETQWRLFRKEDPPRVKPLLYVYRVLLTGIHLMRTAQVEANLVRLNDTARLPYIDDLIARKLSGAEQSQLDGADVAFHEREYERLRGELDAAYEESGLPERARASVSLNNLLVRVRLAR